MPPRRQITEGRMPVAVKALSSPDSHRHRLLLPEIPRPHVPAGHYLSTWPSACGVDAHRAEESRSHADRHRALRGVHRASIHRPLPGAHADARTRHRARRGARRGVVLSDDMDLLHLDIRAHLRRDHPTRRHRRARRDDHPQAAREQRPDRRMGSVPCTSTRCDDLGLHRLTDPRRGRSARGIAATTHWCSYAALAGYGAKPTEQRVVVEGKIITAAGVSSGIDMALRLIIELFGVGDGAGHPARHRVRPAAARTTPERRRRRPRRSRPLGRGGLVRAAEAEILAR